nr:hypothetical protein [Flavobacterium sp. ASV13]
MKYSIIKVCLFICLVSNGALAQVGAGTNAPAKSAVLDLREGSGKKGMLPPQINLVSLTDGTLIAGGMPATGLIVYNTNTTITGGVGYYYWEAGKWNKLLSTSDLIGDNLGNHMATQDVNMANFSIRDAAKTSTQTEQIQLGTDGNAPNVGDIVTAADGAGNVVWRAYPDMKGNTALAFSAISTGQATASATLGNWSAIPGLSNYSYTATATGTLVINANVHAQLADASTQVNAFMYQSGMRFTAKTGGVVVSDPGGTAYGYLTLVGSAYTTANSGKNPNTIVMTTRFPVTAGVTYTLNLEYSDFFRQFSTNPSMAGSITSVGGNVYTSSMKGVLIPK